MSFFGGGGGSGPPVLPLHPRMSSIGFDTILHLFSVNKSVWLRSHIYQFLHPFICSQNCNDIFYAPNFEKVEGEILLWACQSVRPSFCPLQI